jgi:hypothetical protein
MTEKLIPISPQKFADKAGVTKATVCNWLRDGKELAGAQKVERMGSRWIIYVSADFAGINTLS